MGIWPFNRKQRQEEPNRIEQEERQEEPNRIEQKILDAFRKQATELNLNSYQLTSLPPEIGQLKSLQKLYLNSNKLTSLPPEIGQLKSLQKLYLGFNQLTSLPPEIGQLKSLQELYLHANKLTSLPPEIGQLKSLQELSLNSNQRTSLPPEIGQLKSLQKLDLGFKQLTSLPPEIGQLKSLQKLYLDSNQLTSLPPEIGQLKSLQKLYLRSNQLTSLPPEIGQLKSLQKLYLGSNQLTSLPPGIAKLRQLKKLFLHGNKALGLPQEVLGPTWEDVVVHGKEAASPKDILNYYFRTATAKQPLNEAKLILVGFGAVGKTSLVNRLVHKTFSSSESKTDGIQITQWPITLNQSEDIRLNVWDFGGQEIMHSTHQFFLTQRSLYLLVLNGRQGHEDEDAEYWLSLINSFGADSQIIIVLNKIKEQPFNVNRSYLTQKFPNIKAFIETDCSPQIGIEELRQLIYQETDQLEHLRDSFPASWFTIKDELSGMPAKYISYDQYRQICNNHQETDLKAQDALAFYLHTLGIALNYRNDDRLRDTNILNPQWVTNGIYTLINAELLSHNTGVLTLEDLAEVLPARDYPTDRHRFLMELMHKFELCFRFPDPSEQNCRYLVPDLLDKQQPAAATDFDPATCLNFQYHYPVLPEGLLPRFIVRTHVLSTNQYRWRTGVILEFDQNCALVRADKTEKRVTISINGPPTGRRRLLAIIRSDFETIHNSFQFVPQAMVPLPDHPDVVLSYPKLLVLEQEGILSFPEVVGNQAITLNVKQLLDGVDLAGTRCLPAQDVQDGACRLFISYSHHDEKYKNELETHLKLLGRQNTIRSWSDREITPGNEWQGELDEHLDTADIILLLISADFLASDYCYDIEMKRAMERHTADEATVIPVIVRPCTWKSTQFAQLQGLPTDVDRPVTTWGPEKCDRDQAWTEVAQGIEQVAKQRQQSR